MSQCNWLGTLGTIASKIGSPVWQTNIGIVPLRLEIPTDIPDWVVKIIHETITDKTIPLADRMTVISGRIIAVTGVEDEDLEDAQELADDIADKVVDDVVETSDNIEEKILADINDNISDIEDILDDKTGKLSDQIGDISDDVGNATDKIIGEVIGAVIENTGAVGKVIDSAISAITRGFSDTNSYLDNIFDFVSDAVEIEVRNNIILDESIFANVTSSIADIVAGESQSLENVLDTVTGTLGNIISGMLDNELAEIDIQNRALLEIVKAVLYTKDGNAAALASFIKTDEDNIGWNFTDAFIQVINNSLKATVDDLKFSQLEFVPKTKAGSEDLMCALGAYELLRPTDDSARAWFDTISGLITTVMWPLTKATASAQLCLAVDSEDSPWKMIEPGDAAVMRHMGLISDSDAKRIVQRNGYSEVDATRLLNSSQRLPETGEVLAMWLRGSIDDEGVNFSLQQQGYSDTNIELLKDLAFFIPPPQDLITMSVREVFSPEDRLRNGQDEDFPKEFADLARQQGISEKWAKDYWAAHWALPSIQMGFEMLHRGIIDDVQLKGLMKALDIMPGWRDELIQLSYSPYTRVDIRRMHDLGILDDNEVYQAYLELGYSPIKAKNMQQFTIELNQPEKTLSEEEAEGLTRGSVLGFYKDGIIERSQAQTILETMDVSSVAAELFLDNIDFDIERESRKDLVDTVLEKVRNGSFDKDQARTALAVLSLEPTELVKYYAKIDSILDRKVKIPSKADADKFYSAGIMDENQYIDLLERHGYSYEWSSKYLTLLQSK